MTLIFYDKLKISLTFKLCKYCFLQQPRYCSQCSKPMLPLNKSKKKGYGWMNIWISGFSLLGEYACLSSDLFIYLINR